MLLDWQRGRIVALLSPSIASRPQSEGKAHLNHAPSSSWRTVPVNSLRPPQKP